MIVDINGFVNKDIQSKASEIKVHVYVLYFSNHLTICLWKSSVNGDTRDILNYATYTHETRKISIRTKANRPLRDRNRNTLPFDSRMILTSK